MAMINKGYFGEDPAQNTVVIQARHDKEELVARYSIHQRANTVTGGRANNHVDAEHAFYAQPALLDNAANRIDRGDLVFQAGRSLVPRGSLMKNAIPVVSNLNGAYVRVKSVPGRVQHLDETRTNRLIADNIRYIGVSLGSTNPNPDEESEQKEQITVRVQGTMDIFNNGSVSFVPGDIVLWDVPSAEDLNKMKNRYGWSDTKVPLMIYPLRHFRQRYSFIPHIASDAEHGVGNNQPLGMGNDRLSGLSGSLLKLMLIVATNPYVGDFVNKLNNERGNVNMKKLLEDIVETENASDSSLLGKGIKLRRNLMDNLSVELLGEAFQAFMKVEEDMRSRIVGTSLQYGKPGQKFTVMLGQG